MGGRIRTGIGGWTFAPWRGVFYPPGLPQKEELAFASRKLGVIEINGAYYSTFKPDTWRKWRDETPDDFVFAVKGSRFVVNRRRLAEAEESLARFFAQGMTELGPKLGLFLWQLAPTKAFDEADLDAFLTLLPTSLEGRPVRHALEARHPSFRTPQYLALLRRHGVANVYARHKTYPEIADATADFVYARLQTGRDDLEAAYPPQELDAWAARLHAWAEGEAPADLPHLEPDAGAKTPRDVFAFVIHEGKVRAPAAAMALAERVAGGR